MPFLVPPVNACVRHVTSRAVVLSLSPLSSSPRVSPTGRCIQSQLVQTHGEMPSTAVGMSMWMASFLPFYVAEKHSLLASRSTRERLKACLKCVASMEAVARGSRESVPAPAQSVAPQVPEPSPSTSSRGAAGRTSAGGPAGGEAGVGVRTSAGGRERG